MNEICDMEFLLNFEVKQEVMEARMLERAKTSGRSDDNPETIKKRLDTFHKMTQPIIDYYNREKKVVTIDAEGEVEAVYAQCIAKIDEKIIAIQNAVPKVIFLCGGPGCGKGTQCDLIKEKYDIFHHSPGELLRQEAEQGGALGREIKKIQMEGRLVGSDLVVKLLKKQIEGKSGLHIVDGFPRNFENIDMWNKQMIKCCDVQFMLFFECSEQEMVNRALARGASSGRVDDNPETIKKRVNTFVRITNPLVQWFQSQGKREIISSEQPKDKVFEHVEKLFEERF